MPLLLLDTGTIIRSALSDEYASVKILGALDQIWEGSPLLLTSLEDTFLSAGPATTQQSQAGEEMLWEQRLDRAIAQLRAAGLRTSERSQAITKYLELRSQWDSHIRWRAPSMLYSMQQIDTATHRPQYEFATSMTRKLQRTRQKQGRSVFTNPPLVGTAEGSQLLR